MFIWINDHSPIFFRIKLFDTLLILSNYKLFV